MSFAAGLWNATMARSEKGFQGLAFAMTLFAAVAVLKNVRDALPAGTGLHAATYSDLHG